MEDSHGSKQQLVPTEIMKNFENVKISSENKYKDLGMGQSGCSNSNRKHPLTADKSLNCLCLFEKVLSHIFPYIGRSDVLTLRMISKTWRKGVDYFWNNTPRKLTKSLYFHELQRSDMFWDKMPLINPFIDATVIFTSTHWGDYEKAERGAERFLERFSHQLRFLTFYFDDHSYISTNDYRNLIRLLRHSLSISSLSHIDVNIAAGRELYLDQEEVGEILNEYPFPEVTTLKSFYFEYDSWGDPTPLLEPILQSISSGLTSLKIIARVYVILDRQDELQFFSKLNFPHLTQLDIALENIQSAERILTWLGSSPQQSLLETIGLSVFKTPEMADVRKLFGACKLFSNTLLSLDIKLRTNKKLALEELKTKLSRCRHFRVTGN